MTLRIINVEPDRRRIGLSLSKVDSKEFAESDWETALDDLESEDEPEDFDAELELEDPEGGGEA